MKPKVRITDRMGKIVAVTEFEKVNLTNTPVIGIDGRAVFLDFYLK